MWRSKTDIYVTVPYNKVLFSVLYFFTSQSEVDFGMTPVTGGGGIKSKWIIACVFRSTVTMNLLSYSGCYMTV